MTRDQRKYSLLAVRYGPVLLGLTCSAKIILLSHGEAIMSPSEMILHFLNLLLDLSLLCSFYIQGKTFGFCWKHQSLCRTAAWGYLYYFMFFSFGVPMDYIRETAYLFGAIMIVMCLVYEIIR